MPSGVIRLPGTKCPINSEPNCNCIPLVSLINLPSTCLESRKLEMLGGGFLTVQRIVPKPGGRPNKMSPLQTPDQKERSRLTTDNAGPLIFFLLCSPFPRTQEDVRLSEEGSVSTSHGPFSPGPWTTVAGEWPAMKSLNREGEHFRHTCPSWDADILLPES